MNTPLVSVLLPVHNAGAYFSPAVDSILRQSFGNFELLILDDASSDGSEMLADQFALADKRVRVLRSTSSLALSAQLNKGISEARGQFIARMDADDIAMPSRFAEQLKVFNNHPDVGICGCIVETFTETGPTGFWNYPEFSKDIACFQFVQCGFNHPSVMIRTEVLRRFNLNYREDFMVAQDYELWHRVLKVTAGYNIQSELLRYRRFPGQLSQAKSVRKNEEVEQIRLAMRQDLGLSEDPTMADIHRTVASGAWPQDVNQFKKIAAWLDRVYESNLRSQAFPVDEFGRMLADRLFAQCHMSAGRGFNALSFFNNAKLASHKRLGRMQWIRTFLKTLCGRPKLV